VSGARGIRWSPTIHSAPRRCVGVDAPVRRSADSRQADVDTDAPFIQKYLRHASIATTGIHLHVEHDRRHATHGGKAAGTATRAASVTIVAHPHFVSRREPFDLHIRLELPGPAGFRWRGTGTGTRAVIAIQPERDGDPNWGFLFIATEVVFDQHEPEQDHLTEEEAIRVVIHEADPSGHPGFPNNESIT
jgi:hypothetical protein